MTDLPIYYRCSECGAPVEVLNITPAVHVDAAEEADCANARGDRDWHPIYVGAPIGAGAPIYVDTFRLDHDAGEHDVLERGYDPACPACRQEMGTALRILIERRTEPETLVEFREVVSATLAEVRAEMRSS
jgi:hypothetical protein